MNHTQKLDKIKHSGSWTVPKAPCLVDKKRLIWWAKRLTWWAKRLTWWAKRLTWWAKRLIWWAKSDFQKALILIAHIKPQICE